MKILVIEDNEILSRNLVRYLASKEIQAQASFDWKDWLFQASTKYFDAIILDINLPEKDGIQLCKEFREKWKDVPIIMLTSRWTNDDIISGLNIWSDDYLVKPFEYSELLARVYALTRRHLKNKSSTFIKIWNVEINIEKNEVSKDGENISLSKKEFELLKFLSQNKWKALSREEIYEVVWWESRNDFTAWKTLEVYIWYLRKKIYKDFIETKKWFGYMLGNVE